MGLLKKGAMHGILHQSATDSKIRGANGGPTRGRQDPGGPHVGRMNLAIWGFSTILPDVKSQWQCKPLVNSFEAFVKFVLLYFSVP